MRLIDADALIPTQVHTVAVLKDGREQLESVLYAEQVDDAPTVEPASPWHRVNEPPKEDGWYMLCFLSRWRDGNWWIPNFPDYWMDATPPKEEA